MLQAHGPNDLLAASSGLDSGLRKTVGEAIQKAVTSGTVVPAMASSLASVAETEPKQPSKLSTKSSRAAAAPASRAASRPGTAPNANGNGAEPAVQAANGAADEAPVLACSSRKEDRAHRVRLQILIQMLAVNFLAWEAHAYSIALRAEGEMQSLWTWTFQKTGIVKGSRNIAGLVVHPVAFWLLSRMLEQAAHLAACLQEHQSKGKVSLENRTILQWKCQLWCFKDTLG